MSGRREKIVEKRIILIILGEEFAEEDCGHGAGFEIRGRGERLSKLERE